MKHFLGKAYMALFVCLIVSNISVAQSRTGYNWHGIVCDSFGKKAVPGAMIRSSEGVNMLSEAEGGFILLISKIPVEVTFSSIGYATKTYRFGSSGQPEPRNYPYPDTIFLVPETLNEVVVSASRQEQKLQKVTQSMEIIKPQFLANTQTNQVQEIMEKLPSVQVQKDQLTIRGGSGFSYGAGSRVLILLDEMPMLSADASDAKWNYYPIENISQIELLKGAASSLYGSSALEGIVSLRTANADDSPFTQIRAFSGLYDFPELQKKEMRGIYTKKGISLAHRQKIKQLQIISSLNIYDDRGYRQGDEDHLIRGNIKLVYNPRKWSFSFSLNGMNNYGQDFLFFKDAAKPYIPFPNTTTTFSNIRWHNDFSIKNYASAHSSHTLRGRFFSTINQNNDSQSATGNLFFSEYQYQHSFFDKSKFSLAITAGVSNTYSQTISGILYGNHSGNNTAVYLQADQKIGRLNIAAGARLETNQMDTFAFSAFPLYRLGLNFSASRRTFLRASYGQGFRYPSVAERFAATQAGALRIFPNPALAPEKGYSAEAGIRQLFLFRKLNGYVDFAAFTSVYKNMIEYRFDIYLPDTGYDPSQILNYLGFKAQNIEETEIKGLEASAGISQNLGKAEISFYGGYTYILPLKKNLAETDTLPHQKYLTYRRQHLFRANMDFSYKKIGLGIYIFYNSQTKNIDKFFIDVIKGLNQDNYWQNFSSGTITDLRLSYKLNRHADISIFCKNFLNRQYMEMPGNTNPPRIFTVQLSAQL